MPSVIFVDPDGTRHTVEAAAGTSVMEAAIENDIDGIVAECGGSMMCATCHVYVDAEFAGDVPPKSDMEDAMLEDAASDLTENSRLSCQLPLSDALDGLIVYLPERQI